MADVGEGPAPPAPAPDPEPPTTTEKPPEPEPEPEQEETGGAQMKVQQKKQGCLKATCNFFYNPETGKVMGRSGLSWLKIIIFYIIFYFVVFGFFFMLIFGFLMSVKPNKPRLVGPDSVMKNNPGLGFRPRPQKDINGDSSLIWYDRNNEDEIKYFTNQLKKIVLDERNDTKYKGRKGKECNLAVKPGPNEFCNPYGKDEYWGDCTPDNDFGYPQGSPCVLIRLNKIIGWEPAKNEGKDYKKTEAWIHLSGEMIFEEVKKELMPNLEDVKKFVWLSCDGQEWIDKTLIGSTVYYPKHRPGLSIPNSYYPWTTGQKGYIAPFVMVQFQKPTPGVLIQIQCTAYNENIKQDKQKGLGSVHFELFVDGKKD